MSSVLELCISNAMVATALAIIAMAVSWIGRRPALTHTLWLLVLLKLITPPIVRIPVVWQTDAASLDLSKQLDRDEALVTSEAYVSMFEREPSRRDPSTDIVPVTSAITPSTSRDAAGEPTTPLPNSDWPFSAEAIMWLWLTGSACWFGVAIIRVLRFHLLLRHGEPAPITLEQQGANIARQLGLSRAPALWVVPGRISPLLWAVGSSTRLVLPRDLIESLAPEQKATLLAHELAHARRRDHWVRWVEFVALGLYWWHPVAWMARREIRRAEEQCCDAWVVWALPGRARAYAEALLETAGFLSGVRGAVPPVASGIGHAQLLRRRLTMILRESLCPRVSWRTHLAAILLGLGVLPLSPYHSTVNATEPPVSPDHDPVAQVDRETRELERRLDALEKKLERVIDAIEASQVDGRRDGPAQPAAGKRSQASDESAAARSAEATQKKAATKAAAAQKASESKAKARRAAEQARKEAEEELKVADDAKKKADDARKPQRDVDVAVEIDTVDPEEFAAIARLVAESVRDSLDPERLAELGRQIGKAVAEGIDPEQIAELGRQFGESMNRNFDPAQMEELGRKMEELFKASFSPERMRELEMQIEEAVNKAVDPKKIEEMQRALDEASKSFESEWWKDMERNIERTIHGAKESENRKDVEKRKEGAKSDPETTDPRKGARRPSAPERDDSSSSAAARRDTRQLERRMSALEDKMDRLLNALESKATPATPSRSP